VTRLKGWFAEQIKGPKLHSKTGYCRLALERFPGLLISHFEAEWRQAAPASWKKQGRRRAQRGPHED
jgi:hypothetical protein